MKNKKVTIVIGRGFGDEGKGLAVNYFCDKNIKTIVIKHNGGAQAGHTVDLSEDTTKGERFVFHQLSSGSFNGADTLWADTYYPDLYKLGEEVRDFLQFDKKMRHKSREKTVREKSASQMASAGDNAENGLPHIYATKQTCCVIIYDVILNMAIETMRGDNRHGSCGMGINEADLRTKAGYGLTILSVKNGRTEDLAAGLLKIRDEYYPKRLKELGITDFSELPGEYAELFTDDNVAINAAEQMIENSALVEVKDVQILLGEYEHIVFETGQGLLLDAECEKYAPHVTASRTGLYNPLRFLRKYDLVSGKNGDESGNMSEPKLSVEAVYVTRSYVTRHGAGPLPHVISRESLGNVEIDRTNEINPWQGEIRYAYHESVDEMLAPIREDLSEDALNKNGLKVSLFITHLNETDGMLKTCEGDVTAVDLLESQQDILESVYLSYSPVTDSENVRIISRGWDDVLED